jgi:nucleotide-binding universal stress UspA family protein
MSSVSVGHPVVAGVDGSETASQAAGWAAEEAARRRVPLRLLHAVSVMAVATVGVAGASQEVFAAMESEGRQYLNAAADRIRRTHPELEVRLDLLEGDPVPTLIDQSTSAGLVVLGSRGLGGFTGMLVGSVAVSLAAHGHCPVAVIRGRAADEPPATGGPVVVGVDGSPASETAVAWAYEEASLRDTELVAVHAWPELASDLAYIGPDQLIASWESWQGDQEAVLAERLAGWQEKYPDVVVRRVVARDRPVRCLLAHAENAQLVVVGSRGRGGVRGMLLGSTSQALIQHAPCPVLVARPGTSR